MRPVSALVFAALVLPALVACGSSAGGNVPDPGSEDELRTTSSSAKIYDCHTDEDDGLTRFQLSLAASKAQMTDLSKNANPPASGTPDSDYHPTAASYVGSVKYSGFDGMSEENLELIISKDLKEGKDHKRAWVRYRGAEGVSTFGYTCDQKNKAIALDTDRHARLQCELKQMSCKHDNPPGDTCLSDLFVNQTGDDKATLRLNYLDHFTVRVVERKENVGDSSDFSRSGKKFDAKFGQYSVKLEYRAGIAYLGKLELPGNETADIQCSDLAMVDEDAWK